MKPTRQLNRRSFLARVAGGVALPGAFLAVTGDAPAQVNRTGINDHDHRVRRHGIADETCNGRGGEGSVRCYTDNDGTDASMTGQGGRVRTGVTDTDSGAGADAPGYGTRTVNRARTGLTDTDRGAGSDPAGYGVRGNSTGCTDRDSGANYDPPGGGRHC